MQLDCKTQLLAWFKDNQRPLPWRQNRDPYRIWISEMMLQQTTTTAVIPYYERFLKRFPSLQALASSPLEDVYAVWAGLGYYSRARHLHRAAQKLARLNEFPRTHTELLKFPGFGPYTARAVASIAFNDPVGVLDGNVIRVLTRFYGLSIEWWKSAPRSDLQARVDQIVSSTQPHQTNQALMELGSTICTPQNPSCLLCPLRSSCHSWCHDCREELPLKKPRRKTEIWLWQPDIIIKGKKIALLKNDYAPFLRGQFIFPGAVVKKSTKPSTFDFRHAVTHHDIYVTITKKSSRLKDPAKKAVWFNIDTLEQKIPHALIKKALYAFQNCL